VQYYKEIITASGFPNPQEVGWPTYPWHLLCSSTED
jgi:hypothetical protein